MAPFKFYNTILAADVANDGTFTVPYAGADTSATFDADGAHVMVEGSNSVFDAPVGFTVAFAADITVTNKTGRTMKAGTPVTLQLAQPVTNAGAIAPGQGVTVLTDNSGGTSGGNTIAAVADIPTAANAIATLAAKLDNLVGSLKVAGFIA